MSFIGSGLTTRPRVARASRSRSPTPTTSQWGDIMRILYREQTGIDPGAEIVVVGFRSCRLLSLHVGRFVWRPARLLKQRVWHGVPKRGRQHLSLERHCMKCKRPKPKQPKASATLVFHEVLEYINNQFYGLGFCV